MMGLPNPIYKFYAVSKKIPTSFYGVNKLLIKFIWKHNYIKIPRRAMMGLAVPEIQSYYTTSMISTGKYRQESKLMEQNKEFRGNQAHRI
jgi:hypothetical protein